MDHPRRAVERMSFVIKFWTDGMYGIGDIASFRLWQIGLKMHIHATFCWFLEHISQKSQKGYISPIWEKPRLKRSALKLCGR